MTPFETIKILYEKQPEVRGFDYYLRLHLIYGYVMSTPTFFWMAFPVNKKQLEEGLPPLYQTTEPPDCWYVSAFSGNMRRAIASMPFNMPWFAFERGLPDKKRLSIYPTERIRAKLAS